MPGQKRQSEAESALAHPIKNDASVVTVAESSMAEESKESAADSKAIDRQTWKKVWEGLGEY